MTKIDIRYNNALYLRENATLSFLNVHFYEKKIDGLEKIGIMVI